MGFLKNVRCSECGQKTQRSLYTKLADGSRLCPACMEMVPAYMKDSLGAVYDMEDFDDLMAYIDYSNRFLRPMFHETHSYYDLHLDAESGLFYIGGDIDERTVFLCLRAVTEYQLGFSTKPRKKVDVNHCLPGCILFCLKMECPAFWYATTLDDHAKVKIKESSSASCVAYGNPNGMDEFLKNFDAAWQEAREENNATSYVIVED